jgi:DHA1 family bicyclomycin/chloramphenicol resistance-like MFS transporter
MKTSLWRHALVLGLLSALGPFAIDMYLPALPAIGQDLQVDNRGVQASLMAFFVAIGACQLIYGPLADIWGRKRPLYAGIALFALGSIGCCFAPDIHTLVVSRFVQGVGACAGMVVPRAVVRDLHTGPEAARLMSLLMLVFSVSPILAPLAGSAIVAVASWRVIFGVITLFSVLGLVLAWGWLDESRPLEERRKSSVRGALAAYRQLLVDRHFLGVTFIGAFGMSSFFAYLANASFVLIEHYGLTPMRFGMVFGLNAAAFIGTAQLNGRLAARWGLARVIRIGATGACAAGLALLAFDLAGVDRLGVLLGLLFVCFAFLGLVVPTSAVLALEEHGEIAGTASALLGTLQMLTGAAVMAALTPLIDGSARPIAIGIAACTVIAFVFAQSTLAPRTGRVVSGA